MEANEMIWCGITGGFLLSSWLKKEKQTKSNAIPANYVQHGELKLCLHSTTRI